MRIFAAFVTLFALWTLPSSAEAIPQASCNASYEALSAADKARVAYGQFVGTCEKIREQWVSPSPPPLNPGLQYVTGLCADNNYTTSLIRTNACRQEGGVRAWFFGNYTPPPGAPQQTTAPQEHPQQQAPIPQPPRHAPKSAPQRPAQPGTSTPAAIS